MRKDRPLAVSSEVIAALLDEAARALPHECCGILLGRGGTIREVRPAANVHPAPERHFEIDPRALVDAYRAARSGGPEVIGFYHSHPNGLAAPSATDREMAAGDGHVWAIVAAGDVTFWRDDRAGFVPLPAAGEPG